MIYVDIQAVRATIMKTKRDIAFLEAIRLYSNAVIWADAVCTNGKLDEKKLDDLISRRGGMADTRA